MSQLCHTFMKMSAIILGYMSRNRSWTMPSTQHQGGLGGNTWSSFGYCTSEKMWSVQGKAEEDKQQYRGMKECELQEKFARRLSDSERGVK